jgi:hypothetical protein
VPDRTSRTATFKSLGDGRYQFSCDRCPWNRVEKMTRNQATAIAFNHVCPEKS